jgi:uncharacterized flavoprotein (TIGR03862 family)
LMMTDSITKNLPVAVIGGGPAGLMAAEVLLKEGVAVDLFDAMPSVGRKFLVAGKGGLNFTHAEPQDLFLSRYGHGRRRLEPLLETFGPEALSSWMHGLGFETFVGSSQRVFPKTMKAGPVLHTWLRRLKDSGLSLNLRHHWRGWADDDALRFETPDGERRVHARAVVLALGGGSRPRLGSTGAWVLLLRQRGVDVKDLKPANCGFNVNWSEHFRRRFSGEPLKSVALSFNSSRGIVFRKKGEFIITETGIEGSLVYALSAPLRDAIDAHGQAVIHLDLAPDWTVQRLSDRLSRDRGSRSMAGHLEKAVGLKGLKAVLLRECAAKEDFADMDRLASAIKNLKVVLVSARPLDEAISSAGGVAFESLDQNLMIRTLPGVFCAGEMLDWEAPTGGYLLTACFSSGYAAGMGVLKWLRP